jgi:chemotaxis signal transduction protein
MREPAGERQEQQNRGLGADDLLASLLDLLDLDDEPEADLGAAGAARAAGVEPEERGEGLEELIARVDAEVAEHPLRIGDVRQEAPQNELPKHVLFQVRGRAYAIPIEQVLQVDYVPVVTRLPGERGAVLGLANFRGEVMPVIDVAQAAGIGEGARARRPKLLVTRSRRWNAVCGLVVDTVNGLAGLEPAGPVEGDDAGARIAKGQVDHEGGPVRVFDLDGMFGLLEFRTAGAA